LLTRTGNDERWTTFCEGCAHLVRSNIRQESVAHGKSEGVMDDESGEFMQKAELVSVGRSESEMERPA